MDNGEGKERQNNVIVESHYENERKMFKSLILTCILVLVTSCKEQKSQTAGSDYKTQKVTLSDRTVYSTFSATIQGKQDVGVYPQISGLITAVLVKEGAAVKKGRPCSSSTRFLIKLL